MNNLILEDVISSTESSPYIKWNDESLLELIKDDNVYNVFMFNKDGNHGYFSLLHNLTSNLDDDAIIVELGNREGLGILSIYDALKENQTFYTLDIVDDVRFINNRIKDDQRIWILNDFDALDSGRVSQTFKEKSISMIFMDFYGFPSTEHPQNPVGPIWIANGSQIHPNSSKIYPKIEENATLERFWRQKRPRSEK